MFYKGFSLLVLGIGVFLLVQVAAPFLAFKAWEAFAFDQDSLLANPNPVSRSNFDNMLGVSVENIDNFPAFISKNTFYNKPPYEEFKVAIPSVGLEPTTVKTYSEKFETNLAHLPGSALPGEKGNMFVTGHSALPNPFAKNQKAFFASLPNIKKGDLIWVDAGGQQFFYEVVGLKIIDPKDISVIYPPDSEGRYITLMTCVPLGFNTHRLIVLGKLKS